MIDEFDLQVRGLHMGLGSQEDRDKARQELIQGILDFRNKGAVK